MTKQELHEVVCSILKPILLVSEEKNGLVSPDDETKQILYSTIRAAFLFGRYYDKSDPTLKPEDRLEHCAQIMEKSVDDCLEDLTSYDLEE